MTATHHAEQRPSESASNPPRELQVLFHLMDVSRPKAETCAAQAADEIASPEQTCETPCETASNTADLALLATLRTPASDLEEPTAAMPASVPVETTYELLPEPIEEPTLSPAQEREFMGYGSAELPSSPESPTEAQTNEPEKTVAAAPKRTEQRHRRRPAPIKEEWFSSHGKIIAIGFTLALICTIYFARTNRRQIAVPDAATQRDGNVAARIKQTADASKDTPEIVLEMQSPAGQVAASPAAGAGSELGNSAAAGTPGVEVTKADLHSPTIPQLPAPGAEGTKPGATGDDLFVWGKRAEERLAARPELSSTPPANTPAPSLPSSPPVEQSSYPVSNYGSVYGPQPVIQPQQSAPAGAANGPLSNSQENSTRGYRYERSGSGLY